MEENSGGSGRKYCIYPHYNTLVFSLFLNYFFESFIEHVLNIFSHFPPLFPDAAAPYPSKFKKILQDQFMLPKYSQMSGLPLKCGLFTKGHTLRENHLPLLQQLTKADSPTARCRVVCTAPLPCCHFIWLGLAQVLYI